ncbi:hypothetical protein QTP88_007821 [Uroleucon formosanum]
MISNQLLNIQTGGNSPSDFSDNESDWQTVPPLSKHVRSPNNASPVGKKAPDKSIFISANHFSPIAPSTVDEPMESTVTIESNNENKTSKPPPIFIQDQLNYNNFCAKIIELTDASGFDCKSSTKGFKLQTYSPESYRTVIKYLKINNVSFHSFQLKEEKAYRIELLKKEFVIRNITPVTHKLTKTPLPIFFIDLELNLTKADI